MQEGGIDEIIKKIDEAINEIDEIESLIARISTDKDVTKGLVLQFYQRIISVREKLVAVRMKISEYRQR
ncbi:hypothetical protein ACSU1N_04900 [Thermogladius sp. 4427co]|uniref:hypothetical protein n=1 Tax=Thermogladius sp. 4427co TaxID=3450718 RepID=UPI003F7A4D18